MTSSTPSSQGSARANFLSGLLGGLVVLVIGGALVATGVIDIGDTTREVVRQEAITRPASDSKDGRTVADIYRDEGRGVVFVQARGISEAPSIFGQPPRQGTASGSGFVLDKEGTILTNAHVVTGSNQVTVSFSEKGEPVDAKVKGRDPSSDLAVLDVAPKDVKGGLTPVPLGSSSKVRVGDAVVAIGNPFGFTRTVTTGIISARQRQITAPNGFPIRNVIQTDAAINPGNSGGPLLDADGRAIGINSQIATGGGGGSVGIGFAVPIDTAKELLPRLRKGGRIEHAYLGIEMSPVSEQVARDLNLKVSKGALIQQVVPNGPADDAGLRGGRTQVGENISAGGDLIVKVDGEAIKTPDDVAAAIADDRPGDTVEVEYYRGDEKRTTKVKLGKRPAQLDARSEGKQPPSPEGGGGLLPLP